MFKVLYGTQVMLNKGGHIKEYESHVFRSNTNFVISWDEQLRDLRVSTRWDYASR